GRAIRSAARPRFGYAAFDAPEPGYEFEIFERGELVVDHRFVRHAFPLLTLGAVAAAIAIYTVFDRWSDPAIDVRELAVPIELIAGLFFVLIALAFVGLGQVLGRAFDEFPNLVA